MKRLLVLLFFSVMFIITGCATQPEMIRMDLTQEAWQQSIQTNPNLWLAGADRWFVRGEPNQTEVANKHALVAGKNISTISLNYHDFSGIKVDGAFQVQIFGADHDSVTVFGPKVAAQQLMVTVRQGTLIVHQMQDVVGMKQVIVQIGVRQLNRLIQAGCGSIEAVQIRSNHLSIIETSTACGCIYLSGNVNLTKVVQLGAGNIYVFNACPPSLDILSMGSGSVNVAGNVGIRSIVHHGIGNINIIGANSNCLNINASGAGKIGIQGVVNIQEIQAKDAVCIYACNVMSQHLYVCAMGRAEVGLQGSTIDLTVDIYNAATVAGRFLCAQNAFIRANDHTHVNFAAAGKTYIAARSSSSVYFFGPPYIMTKFVDSNASVFSIGMDKSCFIPRPLIVRRDYKGEMTRALPRSVSLSSRGMPIGYRIDFSR